MVIYNVKSVSGDKFFLCVTVSYFKAILLLHWNSYLSNINNNCSLPSFNLLAGFELSKFKLKAIFYHLMVVR